MKAIRYEKYGNPSVMKLAEVNKPTPKADELLIKVNATTTTVADIRVRGFDVPPLIWLPARLVLGFWAPKNKILGAELAGVVEAIGENVTRFKIGDRVFASTLPIFGGYAEYKCLPENVAVAHAPKNLTAQEAASLPIGARTALYYLRKAKIEAGQKVLVYGASGSVGTYAVQLAKHFGAEVTAVCSGRNAELVRSLGASKVIDYTKEDFTQQGDQYDIIFEAVHKTDFVACKQALKLGGTYINVVWPFQTLPMLWARFTSNITILLGDNVPESAEDLLAIKKLAEDGVIKPVIDRCYPLEQIHEAHQYVETGRKRGNVAIKVAESA